MKVKLVFKLCDFINKMKLWVACYLFYTWYSLYWNTFCLRVYMYKYGGLILFVVSSDRYSMLFSEGKAHHPPIFVHGRERRLLGRAKVETQLSELMRGDSPWVSVKQKCKCFNGCWNAVWVDSLPASRDITVVCGPTAPVWSLSCPTKVVRGKLWCDVEGWRMMV